MGAFHLSMVSFSFHLRVCAVNFRHLSQTEARKVVVPKIRAVLSFLRSEKLEVPFIANYRKEYVWPEIGGHDILHSVSMTPGSSRTGEDYSNDGPLPYSHKMLWRIYDWDKKWRYMVVKRKAVAVT